QFGDLSVKVIHLLSSSETALVDTVAALEAKHEQVKADAETRVNTLRETLTSSVQELVSTTQSKNEAVLAAIEARGTELGTSVNRMMAETYDRLAQNETAHESRLNEQF